MTNLNDNNIVLKPNHDTPFGMYLFTTECLEKDIDRRDMIYLL